MKTALALADRKGAFLFQMAPDIVPEGFCTVVESELWGLYFEEQAARAKRGK